MFCTARATPQDMAHRRSGGGRASPASSTETLLPYATSQAGSTRGWSGSQTARLDMELRVRAVTEARQSMLAGSITAREHERRSTSGSQSGRSSRASSASVSAVAASRRRPHSAQATSAPFALSQRFKVGGNVGGAGSSSAWGRQSVLRPLAEEAEATAPSPRRATSAALPQREDTWGLRALLRPVSPAVETSGWDDDDDAEDEVLYSAADSERENGFSRTRGSEPLVPIHRRSGGLGGGLGGLGGARIRPERSASPSTDVLDARWLLTPGGGSTRTYVPLRPSSAQSGLAHNPATFKHAVNVPSRLRSDRF
jgi:hypothetical protein